MHNLTCAACGRALAETSAWKGYAEWWGNPDLQWALAKLGVPERPCWHGEHGIVPTAKRIVALLRGLSHRVPAGRTGRPARGALSGTGGSASAAERKTAERQESAQEFCLQVSVLNGSRPRVASRGRIFQAA